MPRFSADSAYSKRRSGVRWAETTFVSCGIPRASRICAACCIVSQSDLEPMMTPTSASGPVIPSGVVLPVVLKLPTQSVRQVIDLEVGFHNHLVREIVLVRNSDVSQHALLDFFHLPLVLELQQQIADPAKTLAVVRSDSVRRQSSDVLPRSVPGVGVPNIVRI